MLACTIHAKEDLRIETATTPVVGPGEVLVRLGAGGICGSDLHYYFEGRNGSFVIREPLIPGPRGVRRRRGRRGGRHARQGRRQDRGQPVARVRPLRLLPAGPRAAVHEHEVPRQREPLPARAGNVPGILRDGRAAVLSGHRRRLARRARVRRAAGRRAARRQSRRRSPRQVGADHRRRHDRLPHRDGGAPCRRGAGHRQRRPRPAAREGARGRCRSHDPRRPRRRRARRAAVRRGVRGVRATSPRSSPASRPQRRARASCRSARCRTSRCRSSSTS